MATTEATNFINSVKNLLDSKDIKDPYVKVLALFTLDQAIYKCNDDLRESFFKPEVSAVVIDTMGKDFITKFSESFKKVLEAEKEVTNTIMKLLPEIMSKGDDLTEDEKILLAKITKFYLTMMNNELQSMKAFGVDINKE